MCDFGDAGRGLRRPGLKGRVGRFVERKPVAFGRFGLRMLLVLRLKDFGAAGRVLVGAAVLVARLVGG